MKSLLIAIAAAALLGIATNPGGATVKGAGPHAAPAPAIAATL